MTRIWVVFFVWLCLVPLLPNFTFAAQYEFEKVELTLSQNSVQYVLQDNRGYLWLATQNGINRYDGYDVKIFNTGNSEKCHLPSTDVKTLLQDSLGTIWAGTSDGVARKTLNSNCFDTFIRQQKSVKSVSNTVGLLFEDSKNRVWMLGNELSYFSITRNKFQRIGEQTQFTGSTYNEQIVARDSLPTFYVAAQGKMTAGKHATLWFGTIHGLSKFNEKTQQLELVFQPAKNSHNNQANPVTSIIIQDDHTLWLGTQDGVYHINDDGKQLAYFQFNQQKTDLAVAENFVNQLYVDKYDQLWVATLNGARRYVAAEKRFVSYLKPAPNGNENVSNRIEGFITDSQGQLWVGAQVGVYRYDQTLDKFWHYGADQQGGLGITNGGNTYRLFATRSGALYVSVQLSGLYKMRPFKNKFSHIKHLDVSTADYDNNIVRAVFEETDMQGKVVWLGLDGAGVKRISFKTDAQGQELIDSVVRYRHLNRAKDSLMSGEYIHAIHRDSLGKLWLATSDGLREWDEKKQDFVVASLNDKLPLINQANTALRSMIYTFLDDGRADNLWLAGDNVLGYQTISKDKVIYKWFTSDSYPPLKDNIIYKLFQDNAGILWLATSNGLGRFDPISEEMKLWQHQSGDSNSLAENWVHGIVEMPQGSYWLATRGGGLNRLTFDDKAQAQWQHFTTKDGLADNTLYGLLGDKQGNLWFSSNKGLTRFNTIDYSVRNFSPSDGLQGDEFNYGVAHAGQSGNFYFGGINGLNRFKPAQVKENTVEAKVVLTELLVQGLPIDNIDNIDKSDQPLVLAYDKNNLRFSYVGLHFDEPSANKYAYQLIGIDSDWNYDELHHIARYSALPAGEYQFRVKVANSDGKWSRPYLLASITISKPIWQTYWAYLGYIILVFLAGGLYKKQRDNRERRLQQRIGVATSDLARANEHIRLQFQSFAHEVKTPLMSVSNHCALAVLKLDRLEQESDLLTQVKESLQRANNSLDDIRLGVKQELDNAELRIKHNNKKLHIDIFYCLQSLLSARKHRAAEKQITLNTSLADNSAIYAQPGALELVVGNLLDNAIQYTPAGGDVNLTVTVQALVIEIEVSDSGRGISVDEQANIFLHSYRGLGLENSQGRGMGLFLVKATLDNNGGTISLKQPSQPSQPSQDKQGCRFVVTLPKGDIFEAVKQSIAHILPKQLASNNSALITQEINIKAAFEFTLLIVDDNDELRESLVQIFSEFYHCISANNAEVGLAKAIEHCPDLIITDVRMETQYSGIELARALKEHDETSHIPLIVCSAMSDNQTKLDALQAEADVWVDKSANISVLIAHVHTLLSQRQRIKVQLEKELRAIKLKSENNNRIITKNPHADYFNAAVKAVIIETYQESAVNFDTLLSQHLKESTRNVQYKAKKFLPAGLTLKICLNGYRGMQAMKMLSGTDLPIKVIYLDAGFANERQMSRWFDKCFSLTPSQYRASPPLTNHDNVVELMQYFRESAPISTL